MSDSAITRPLTFVATTNGLDHGCLSGLSLTQVRRMSFPAQAVGNPLWTVGLEFGGRLQWLFLVGMSEAIREVALT